MLRPFSNSLDVASWRRSCQRKSIIPISSLSFWKSLNRRLHVIWKIGCSSIGITFSEALSCSLSAFKALDDRGIVRGLPVLVRPISSVCLEKLMWLLLIRKSSDRLTAVSTATVIIRAILGVAWSSNLVSSPSSSLLSLGWSVCLHLIFDTGFIAKGMFHSIMAVLIADDNMDRSRLSLIHIWRCRRAI